MITRAARGGLTSSSAATKLARPVWSSCQSYRRFTATAAKRDEERKWSTPLAKQLTEAINVSFASCSPYKYRLTRLPDHRTSTSSQLYAHVSYFRHWRLLHRCYSGRSRPVWQKGRFHYFARDFANIWRADWHLVRRGMDLSGPTKIRRRAHGSRAGQRHPDG
jgi:hypothetical protein